MVAASLPADILQTYSENIWRRFPEVFLSLGAPIVDECYAPSQSRCWHRRVVDSPDGKLVEVFLPRRPVFSAQAVRPDVEPSAADGGAVAGPCRQGSEASRDADAARHAPQAGPRAGCGDQAVPQDRDVIENEHAALRKLSQLNRKLGHLKQSLPARISRELHLRLGWPESSSCSTSPRLSTSSSIVSSLAERRGKSITPIKTAPRWRETVTQGCRAVLRPPLQSGIEGAGPQWKAARAAAMAEAESPGTKIHNFGRQKRHMMNMDSLRPSPSDSPGCRIQRMARQRQQSQQMSAAGRTEETCAGSYPRVHGGADLAQSHVRQWTR